MRLRTLGLCLVLVLSGVGYADVRVGDVREAQARAGVALREVPKPLGKLVRLLPYGARVSVEEVQGFWARVRTTDAAVGWVKAMDLVAPGALTQAPGGGGGTVASSADISAAGRQFDEGIETQYRAAHADLEAAYRALDALEAKTPAPGAPEVEAFVRDGRLGR